MNILITEPPQGIALYVRKITKLRHKSPIKFAKLCAEHGLKWIALGTIWHDDKGRNRERELIINPVSVINDYSQALYEEGIQPHIWGYPWYNRINLFVEKISTYLNPYIVGIILDPELGLKNHLQEAIDLFKLIRALNPYLIIGLTSYGLPKSHKTFPFGAFAKENEKGDIYVECDYGSPQLYDLPENKILEGISDYKDLGFDYIIPSYGTYKRITINGKKKAIPLSKYELNNHLNNFIKTPIPIYGAIGWAENFMTQPLWEVISRWSEVFESGGTL